jgi:hypothetical protein
MNKRRSREYKSGAGRVLPVFQVRLPNDTVDLIQDAVEEMQEYLVKELKGQLLEGQTVRITGEMKRDEYGSIYFTPHVTDDLGRFHNEDVIYFFTGQKSIYTGNLSFNESKLNKAESE